MSGRWSDVDEHPPMPQHERLIREIEATQRENEERELAAKRELVTALAERGVLAEADEDMLAIHTGRGSFHIFGGELGITVRAVD